MREISVRFLPNMDAWVTSNGDLTPTEHATVTWVIRDRQRSTWIEEYWASRHDAQRLDTMAALEKVAPFASLVEIGCNCGPNLYLIHQRWPAVIMTGVEVNEAAADACRVNVPEAMVVTADLMEWLPLQPDSSYDMLLSQRTLEYFSPDDIRSVLGHCRRISRNMILREPHGHGERREGDFAGWRHPYPELLAEIAA